MDEESIDVSWIPVEVDGEIFEWHVVEATVMDSDGHPPHVQGRTQPRPELVLMMRRPATDRHSFGLVLASRSYPDEAEVREAIRSCRDTTSLALDWRPHERAHARELAIYWSRLPVDAQAELAQRWLARCAHRFGAPLNVNDSTDLHEVSAETLRAARERGLAFGDEEASAQEEDVRVAFERYVEPW